MLENFPIYPFHLKYLKWGNRVDQANKKNSHHLIKDILTISHHLHPSRYFKFVRQPRYLLDQNVLLLQGLNVSKGPEGVVIDFKTQ